MAYQNRRDFLKTTAAGALGFIGFATGANLTYANPIPLPEQLLDAFAKNPHITYDKAKNEFFVRSRILQQPGYRVAEVWVAHPAKMERQMEPDGKSYEKPVPDRAKPLKLMWGNIPRPAFDIHDTNHDGIPDSYVALGRTSPNDIVYLNDRSVEEKAIFGQRFSSGIEALIKHIEKSAREYTAPSAGPR